MVMINVNEKERKQKEITVRLGTVEHEQTTLNRVPFEPGTDEYFIKSNRYRIANP